MTLIAVRLILGIALVLHGLASTVLPLRGVDAVGAGISALPLSATYMLAIIGFVCAGLGVLGVRPLSRLLPGTALVAGLSAMVAHRLLDHQDLWMGVLLNILLPIAVVAFSRFGYFEPHTATHPRWRVITNALGFAFLAWVIASVTLWPFHRTWGTTPEEWTMSLPGDREPRSLALEIFHGVTVNAPPSAVWPWLVQIGQDRAGFYSYERLERLFGVDIHNAREIRPEWQARNVGEYIPATQPGYLGGVFGERPGWTVQVVEPNRVLVLRQWGAFVLVPYGEGRTRFLIRSTVSNKRIPAWAAGLNFAAFELPHFIMQRRMMLNIKALAEGSVIKQAALTGGAS